jgi:hypothetical protein
MLVMAVVALACSSRPGAATANYEYQPDEYVTIERGQAPDGRHALAAHGEGEFGDGDFHVWLMEGGRRIAALPGISEHNNLDTRASAYNAFWAPDSRHVAVSWRTNRHIMQLNLYAIDGGRVRLVALPDLFKEITGRVLRDTDEIRTEVPLIEWAGRSHFVMKQYRSFAESKHTAPALLRALGRFGQLDDKQPREDQIFIVSTVDAEFTLRGSQPVRMIELKPGDRGWWRPRVWDPR